MRVACFKRVASKMLALVLSLVGVVSPCSAAAMRVTSYMFALMLSPRRMHVKMILSGC